METIIDLLKLVPGQYWLIASLLFVVGSLFFQKGKGITEETQQKNRKNGMFLSVTGFQVAPFGMDAFLKIQNNGPGEITISLIEILDRNDIVLKNAASGQKMSEGQLYSLLLEATGQVNMEAKAFRLRVTCLDAAGKTAQQVLSGFA